MPILLKVSELEPGMVITRNVVNKFNILLPHGRVLEDKDITALQKRFPDLQVQIGNPLLDEIAEFQDETHCYEISRKIRSRVEKTSKKINDAMAKTIELTPKEVMEINNSITQMVKEIQHNPASLAIVEQTSSTDNYFQEHAANVFYLSLVLGNAIRHHIKKERERMTVVKSVNKSLDLTPLATAAFFIDLGMTPIESLVKKNEPLSPQEIQLIHEHPNTGADMLPPGFSALTIQAMRQHHENNDGSGYPNKLSGSQIGIYARILRVADAYCSASSQQLYSKAKPAAQVQFEMLYGRYQHFYDPVILKIFSMLVSPFPIGAKLQLEDGTWAVVTKNNKDNTFNPQLIIAYDELGDPLDPALLRGPFYLGSRDDIKVKSFGGDDISFVNLVSHYDTYHPANENLDLGDYEEIFASESKEISSDVFDLMFP